MNIFGIPVIIPFDYYQLFIENNFSALSLSNDTIFLTYLLANFVYLGCIVLFVKLVYKTLIFIKNEVFF